MTTPNKQTKNASFILSFYINRTTYNKKTATTNPAATIYTKNINTLSHRTYLD